MTTILGGGPCLAARRYQLTERALVLRQAKQARGTRAARYVAQALYAGVCSSYRWRRTIIY
jgi:hypothetical protein